jgi:hypothetical protein
MRDLLFSVPWYLPTVTAIIGLALLVNGNRRQNPRLRGAGAGVMLAAVGWAGLSYLVETPKEICARQTRQFVQAVVDRNWPTFDGLVAPTVSLAFFGGSASDETRDQFTPWVKAKADQIVLKSAALTDVTPVETGNTITVTIRVWSVQDASMGQPLDSEWDVDWQSANGKWLIHEIRALRVGNIAPDQLRGALRVH